MFETSAGMKSPSSRQSLKNNRFFNSQVKDSSPSESLFRNRTGCNLDRLLFDIKHRRDISVCIKSKAGRNGAQQMLTYPVKREHQSPSLRTIPSRRQFYMLVLVGPYHDSISSTLHFQSPPRRRDLLVPENAAASFSSECSGEGGFHVQGA